MRRVGAPLGGRVHWFLLNLSSYVRNNFSCRYEYLYHNYILHRRVAQFSKNNVRYMSVFVVNRTSKKCWRVMAFYVDTAEVKYKSFKTSIAACAWIDSVAQEWHSGREWTRDREFIGNQK